MLVVFFLIQTNSQSVFFPHFNSGRSWAPPLSNFMRIFFLVLAKKSLYVIKKQLSFGKQMPTIQFPLCD